MEEEGERNREARRRVGTSCFLAKQRAKQSSPKEGEEELGRCHLLTERKWRGRMGAMVALGSAAPGVEVDL